MYWKMCSGFPSAIAGTDIPILPFHLNIVRIPVIQAKFQTCRDGVGRGVEVSIANGYPFVRLGAHTPFLSWSNSSLGTNNSAYPESKQTTIFWIKLTGARFSFLIGRNATENSPEKFCCFSEAQLLQAISPPIRSTSRRIFSLASLFHSVKHLCRILRHVSSLAREEMSDSTYSGSNPSVSVAQSRCLF